MVRYQREMRGIPVWLLAEYLQELGGKLDSDGNVSGTEWIGRLEQMEDYRIGSLRVGQVRLVIEASEEAFEILRPGLEKKLLRAGG
jgi:hypothetical protein